MQYLEKTPYCIAIDLESAKRSLDLFGLGFDRYSKTELLYRNRNNDTCQVISTDVKTTSGRIGRDIVRRIFRIPISQQIKTSNICLIRTTNLETLSIVCDRVKTKFKAIIIDDGGSFKDIPKYCREYK